MANYLASIFGTEQDKVNCSFYYKIGACRHGDRCSRKHVKPSYSQTVLMPNLYQNPAYDNKSRMTQPQLQSHFDAFYEDIWAEMCKYGEIEELVVCDNNNDHLIGNVYARFKYEDSAQKACDELNSRWYAGRPIYCELSPVTDFREACCRLNSGEGCARGGYCNFIHRKMPSPDWEREIELSTKKWLQERGRDPRSVSRSPSPEPTNPRGKYKAGKKDSRVANYDRSPSHTPPASLAGGFGEFMARKYGYGEFARPKVPGDIEMPLRPKEDFSTPMDLDGPNLFEQFEGDPTKFVNPFVQTGDGEL